MQTIMQSGVYANTIDNVTNSNYATMLWCYTRDNLHLFVYAAAGATRRN